MKKEYTPEEIALKNQLNSDRQSAVKNAWRQEAIRILEGKGTRDWTIDEQKQILSQGSCEGYEGHHMKSVSEYPEEAKNPDNIQFLTREEHLAAHDRYFANATCGYYDPDTGETTEFSDGEITELPERELSEPFMYSEDGEDFFPFYNIDDEDIHYEGEEEDIAILESLFDDSEENSNEYDGGMDNGY